MDPIAIIGQAFRLPGDVETDAGLWELLESGRNVMSEWPKSRSTVDTFYNPGPQRDNRLTSRGAHFLNRDPAVFDAPFFSITSKEAAAMDPQQRWLLETSYRAFENAGLPVEKVSGTPTSVFTAFMTDDYTRMVTLDPELMPTNVATGTCPAILANRLSWYYNLLGPSIAVNTACSSSMMALDLACQSLRTGQCSMAVVGGGNAIVSLGTSLNLHSMSFLSPDSLSRSFDASANGYARGEGVVVFILKPLSDAIRDGDAIRAVLRATGANQDGHTPGFTQPNPAMQEELVRSLYKKCGLGLETTRYFEAHGTGTQVGDAAEANAIGRVFRSSRSVKEPLYIGSIKSTMGHLEGVSSLASILKSILMLEKGLIPPNALFNRMNPKINAKFYNLQVPTKCMPWPASGLRRISINSFGLGGANGHVILDDTYHTLEQMATVGIHNTLAAPPRYDSTLDDVNVNHASANDNAVEVNKSNGVYSNGTAVNGVHNPEPRLLVLSTKDEAAMGRMLEKQSSYYLSSISGSKQKIDSFAYLLAAKRSLMAWRSFGIARAEDPTSISFATPVRSSREIGLAFVFTGQGAQYANMGMELLHFSAFRNVLEQVEREFQNLGAEWSLFDEIQSAKRINSPQVSQPVCTALQLALIALLDDWNLRPATVIGHSSGEIAAAYAIGALDLASACKVAFHRGRLAGELATRSSSAMMSVNLSETSVASYLADRSLEQDICVACVNSPTNTTLSGKESDIDTLKAHLDQEGIFAQKLRTGLAYHSPAMQQIAQPYLDSLTHLSQGAASQHAVMISSVTGSPVSINTLLQPQYWVDNLVSPVRFLNSLEHMLAIAPKEHRKSTVHDIIEIGPHGALQRPIKDTMAHLGKTARYTTALSKFDKPLNTILNLVGSLFCRGYPVDVVSVNQQKVEHKNIQGLFDVPSYPFDTTLHYWHESRLSSDWRRRSPTPAVLGFRSADWNPSLPRWRKILTVDESPWIADHVVGDVIVFPGAGTIIMALEAVRQMSNAERTIDYFHVEEAVHLSPIIVKPEAVDINDRTEVVTHLRPLDQSHTRFEANVFSYHNASWRECFKATIRISYQPSQSDDIDNGFEARAIEERYKREWEYAQEHSNQPISKSKFYKSLHDLNLHYGDAFEILDNVYWDGGECGRSRIDLNQSEHGTDDFIHPIILDAVCQTVFASASRGASETLPSFIPHRILDTKIAASGWKSPENSHINTMARSKLKTGVMGVDCEVTALAADGSTLAHISKMEMLPVMSNVPNEVSEKKLMHSLEWKPQLSSLSQKQLRDLCHPTVPQTEDIQHSQYLQRLDRTLRTIIRPHLAQLKNQDWSKVPEHHRKFFNWLSSKLHEDPHELPSSSNAKTDEIELLRNERHGWAIFTEVALQLTQLVNGELNPLDLLFPTGLAERLYDDVFGQMRKKQLETYLGLVSHQKPTIRVLEVGAGTGGMSDLVLSILQEIEERTGGISFSEYVYTDISASFFEKAKEKFSRFGERIGFRTFNIETDVSSEGFELASFDVIIAGSVLHATSNLSTSLRNLHQLLAPGGQMVFHETTRPDRLFMGLGFGPLKGWWLGEEDFRQDGPTITEDQWDSLLRDNGFSGNDLVVRDYEEDAAHTFSIITTTACQSESTSSVSQSSRIICILDGEQEKQQRLSSGLAELIKHDPKWSAFRYEAFTLADFTTEFKPGATDYVVMLAEVGSPLLTSISSTVFNALRKCMQVWKNLLWVTSAHGSDFPFDGLKDGFLRVLRAESHEKKIVSLTLEETPETDALSCITQIFDHAFILQSSPEIEYRIQNNIVTVPRLVADSALNSTLEKTLHLRPSSGPWLSGVPLKLDITQRGSLETLCYTEDFDNHRPLGDNEVEIEAKAWGLSFRDVYMALGKLEEDCLGTDCSGIVNNIGKDVKHVKKGDRVCMAAQGSMKAYPRGSQWIAKIPETLSFEEAAALVNPGLTAYHSLIDMARLQEGEKILIHSAAGGTGQLAVQIAQMVGAEVFCTVGYQEKKDILTQNYGIPDDHIFYSRNNSFKDGIFRMTEGYGVDVVLNSLTGEGLRASWQCIAPFGRFVELGKIDIITNSQLPMSSFAKNVSYMAVDLAHIWLARPAIGERGLAELMRLIDNKTLRSPYPVHSFRLDQAEDAFRYFQGGKNTGRTVISVDSNQIVTKRVRHRLHWRFEADATYLIAGGLGGLGRALMKWMASRGAKNLVALSRSSSPSTAAAKTITELQKQGVNVATFQCDVSSSSSLQTVLAQCTETMPPIRGCINAAMNLQDSIFENMTHSQWQQTVSSKVATSWNLHTHLPPELDFFIFLSSAAGVVGSTSQANYAAGCTFQDSLARARVARGQKSLSIDLGAMRAIGYIAETEAAQRMFEGDKGLIMVEENEFLGLLDIFCEPGLPCTTDLDKAQVSLGLATPADMIAQGKELIDLLQRPLYGYFSQPPAKLKQMASSQNVDYRSLFVKAEDDEGRASVVADALARKLARALSIQPEDVDQDKPLHVYGIDSLVAVELRNWIVKQFGAEVAVFDIMGLPSVAALCDHIVKNSTLVQQKMES